MKSKSKTKSPPGTSAEKFTSVSKQLQSVNQTAESLTRVTQKASKACLDQLLGSPSSIHGCHTETDGLPLLQFEQWMAINLIAGPEFRLTLKLMYRAKSAHELSLEPKLLTTEYCQRLNELMAASFQSSGIQASFLPTIITRGLDEIFFPDLAYPKLAEGTWYIQHELQSFKVAFTFEMIDSGILRKLHGFCIPDPN